MNEREKRGGWSHLIAPAELSRRLRNGLLDMSK